MYNGLVKSVRHIQVKQISFHPKLFEAIITYQPHPTEFNESDELEYQKLPSFVANVSKLTLRKNYL